MKSKSLILKIFIYLSIFSFLILFFIWILQILLLNKYYEYYKTNELTNTLNLIKRNFNKENFSSVLENVAYNTDFCVEITSNMETIYSNIQNNKGCIDSNSNTILTSNIGVFNKVGYSKPDDSDIYTINVLSNTGSHDLNSNYYYTR